MSVHGGCLVPRGGCLLRGVPGPGGGGLLQGIGVPAWTEADPPGETATATDGTHPTGMHSCFLLKPFKTPRNLTIQSVSWKYVSIRFF